MNTNISFLLGVSSLVDICHPQQKGRDVSQIIPNDLGLYDMNGNVLDRMCNKV